MKKILILTIFAILVSILSYSVHYVHAESSDSSCTTPLGKANDCATWWTSFYQTIALVATLAVLAWQVILQKKALSIDEYDKLREDHHDLIRLQEEVPDTLEVFTRTPMPTHYVKMGKDIVLKDNKDKIILNFYVATFDLWERVWNLKEEENKKIKIKYFGLKSKVPADEWLCWMIYLERMSQHWLFRVAFNQSKYVFDNNFMEHIKNYIIDMQDNNGMDAARNALIKDLETEYKKEGDVLKNGEAFPFDAKYVMP